MEPCFGVKTPSGSNVNNLRNRIIAERGGKLEGSPLSRPDRRRQPNTYRRLYRLNLASINSLLPPRFLDQVSHRLHCSNYPELPPGIDADGLGVIWKPFPNEIRKNPPVIIFLVRAAQGQKYKPQGIGPKHHTPPRDSWCAGWLLLAVCLRQCHTIRRVDWGFAFAREGITKHVIET